MEIKIQYYSSHNNIATIVTIIHIQLIIVKDGIIDTIYQALAFNL